MSSTLGSGIYQDDSLTDQSLGYWPQQTQYWPSRHLFSDSTVTSAHLGQSINTSVYPLYPQPDQYTMPTEISAIGQPSRFELGSQSNPIILGSDDDDVIHQSDPPSASQDSLWAPGPPYAHYDSKQRSRKRKIGDLENAEGGFAATIGETGLSVNEYAQQLKEESTAKFALINSDENRASKLVKVARHQAVTWDQSLLNPTSDTQPCSDFSEHIPNIYSKGTINLDQAPGYSSFDIGSAGQQFFGADVLYSGPNYSNSVPLLSGRQRKVSTLPSSTTPDDLQQVRMFFTEFLSERRSNTLECSHGASAISSILSAIRSEDRRKGANLPYSHEGKVCLFRCSECKMTVCAGCGAKVGKIKQSFDNLSHNCIDSQLISIILVLAKIDSRWQLREFGSPKSPSSTKVNAATPTEALNDVITVSAHPSAPARRTNSSKSKSGIGYGTGHVGGGKKKVSKTTTRLKHESEDNRYLAKLLAHLVTLIKDEDEEFSMIELLAERQAVLVSSIRVSYLLELIRSLVRNDSIMDIDACNSWDIYAGCLELLRVFSSYDPLLDLLITPPQEKKSSPGLAKLIDLPEFLPLKGFAPNKKRVSLPTTSETVDFILLEGFDGVCQPIIHSFQGLVKQCQAFMKNASRIGTNEDDEETEGLLAFCTDVDSTAIELSRRAGDLQTRKDEARPLPEFKNSHLTSPSPDILAHPIFSSTQAQSSLSLPTALTPLEVPPCIRHECRQALSGHLQFKFSPIVTDTHIGANLQAGHFVKNTTNTSIVPGRMKRLIKELTVLSTTLPPGIFIRVQEDRSDLFKAMIVGPDSSPYHLGLYEFDFSIPNNYPNVPPLVTFKTTGGGRVRFNPNLYEAGKVCLSILGTWSGSASEQWQPKSSTLLQVLVSIQSMILCAEPYYNEPGYEQHPNAAASRAYNENVQFNSIRLAMNDWLSYDGLWNDVIQAHFLAYTPEILSTTQNFVRNSSTRPAPHLQAADFSLASFMPFGNSAPPSTSPTSIKSSMQKACQDLEASLKSRLPEFLSAGLWKEPIV